jgi:hypothetical protein
LEDDYKSSFHGQIGGKEDTFKYGGYFTGYQISHGSKTTAKDVQIKRKVAAIWKGTPGSAYAVTYRDLQFIWNDIINVNPKYKMDSSLANYAKWEKEYTSGGPRPRDYTLHIKWESRRICNH